MSDGRSDRCAIEDAPSGRTSCVSVYGPSEVEWVAAARSSWWIQDPFASNALKRGQDRL